MSETILIIDDSPEIHTLVKVRLGKSATAKLHSAFDGKTGIELARQLRPDLILLDVSMPDRDGFSICRELKSDPATMNTPIIFLTGASSTEEKIRGLEMGATDYITKPFDPAELRARVQASLRTKYLIELLSKKAMIDGLTGLWNRTYLDATFVAELANARTTGRPLACVMADVDHFKTINDKYGHACGDEVLRAIAAVLTQQSPPTASVCRYGGEEFAILLIDTTADDAKNLAEILRGQIEKLRVKFRDEDVSVTCSFGVANMGSSVPPTVIELADSALYQAKHSGRNRVALASNPTRAAA